MCLTKRSSKIAHHTKSRSLMLALTITVAMNSSIALAIADRGVIGWDGDKDAVIAHKEGSYHIRDGKNMDVTFGIFNNPATFQWYNDAGHLPCLVTQFERDNCTVRISNFGDKVTIDGNAYVAIYSRVSIYNHDVVPHDIDPAPPPGLPSLTPATGDHLVDSGKTRIYDYVIAVDRFGATYGWPSDAALLASGSWDAHYSHMRDYWNNRLSGIVDIKELPDRRLIDAYKAGYIYTHIVKDPASDGAPNHYELKTGEEFYDDNTHFHNDVIGILSTLLTIGETGTEAEDYLKDLPTTPSSEFPQAAWLYPWPWAIYLAKTDNRGFVEHHFEDIRSLAGQIVEDEDRSGLIHPTTIYLTEHYEYDNWSALMGLASYKYICDTLQCMDCATESAWAETEYNKLLARVNEVHGDTIQRFELNYLPISMDQPNTTKNLRYYPKDANWAIALNFGHWAWDAYLFGAPQDGVELDMIDATYAAGFQAAELQPHNFGAYSANGYSSAYNAGYGGAALRGENYRSEGIYAYLFMLDNGQSGPFSWWESFTDVEATGWEGTHPGGNAFLVSCPHIFGQATATKVLIDSLIALKSNGSVIIGRGVPNEWVAKEKVIEVDNFPTENLHRMGFTLTGDTSNQITLHLTGDAPSSGTILDLRAFKNNIASVSAGSYCQSAGSVTLPSGVITTTVTLITGDPPPILGLLEAESAALAGCYPQIDTQASSGYRVDGIDMMGDSVEFSNVPAGTHLVFGYASPWSGPMNLYVNGVFQTQVNFTATPGGWNGPFAPKNVPMNIPAGASVKIQFTSGSMGINLDYLQVY